jgi:hypothetical protein
MAGVVQVSVDVPAIGTTGGGPIEPSDDVTVEPSGWPEIETVSTTVMAGVDGE